MLLERNPVTDERHAGSGRAGPGSRTASASIEIVPTTSHMLVSDEHLRPGHVAAESVRVANRHDPDPGVLGGAKRPPVARRLPRGELRTWASSLSQRSAGRGPTSASSPRGRPVKRDPAPGRVETRDGQHQRGGAVRRVTREDLRTAPSHGGSARAGRRRTRSRSRRSRGASSARRPRIRPRQLGEPPATHARVELQVHGDALRHTLIGHVSSSEASRASRNSPAPSGRAPGAAPGSWAQRHGLADRGDGEHGRAGPECGRPTSTAPWPYPSALTTAQSSAGWTGRRERLRCGGLRQGRSGRASASRHHSRASHLAEHRRQRGDDVRATRPA